MIRPAAVYLILTVILFLCPGQAPAGAQQKPEQAVLLAGEEYVGSINQKQTRYLKVTLTNLADDASTGRIAFYKNRIELSPDRVGPEAFRTFTLKNPNDSQARIWTTLNFDEFTLNAETGKLQVIVEKTAAIK